MRPTKTTKPTKTKRKPKEYAPKPALAPRVLRPAPAAIYSGVSKQRLWKHRRENTGPAFLRLGRGIGYLVDDLDRWLEAQRAVGTLPREVR